MLMLQNYKILIFVFCSHPQKREIKKHLEILYPYGSYMHVATCVFAYYDD